MDVMQMGPRPPPESDKKRMGLIQNLPEREREREKEGRNHSRKPAADRV